MGSASEVLTGSSAPPSIWGRGRAAQPACFGAALIALISLKARPLLVAP
jgi:hypothetical protein